MIGILCVRLKFCGEFETGNSVVNLILKQQAYDNDSYSITLYVMMNTDTSIQKQPQKIFISLQHQKIQCIPLSQFYPSPT